MGTNDQIIQGEKLVVTRFQRPSQVVFFSLTLTWVDTLFQKLTPQIGE